MLILRALALLPFPLIYILAWLVYITIYHVLRYRREVVTQNLKQAFPDKTAVEIEVIAREFYRQLADVLFEAVKSNRMTAAQVRDRVKIINGELIREKSGNFTRSVILLAIHQGNWEWLLQAIALQQEMPLHAIYKPLHIGLLDRFVLETRSRLGCRLIPIAEASRNMLAHRREHRLLFMLADQAPIASERSYWLPYLNAEAAFHVGGERLAHLTGFPVVFAQCRRVSRGRYEVEMKELAEPPYDRNSHEILERYVAQAEAAVRDQPESFLWSNRRWKRSRAEEETGTKATHAG